MNDIHSLKYILSDLNRPSLDHIKKKLIEFTNQEDLNYKNTCLKITKTNNEELADLKYKAMEHKEMCKAYGTIIALFFNEQNLINQITTLEQRESNNVRG